MKNFLRRIKRMVRGKMLPPEVGQKLAEKIKNQKDLDEMVDEMARQHDAVMDGMTAMEWDKLERDVAQKEVK